MKRLNLLWLWDRLDSVGGVETVMLNLAGRLDKKKYKIALGVFKAGLMEARFREAGVEVKLIKRNGKFDPFVISRILKLIRELEIDIVQTHGHLTGIAGRIAGRLAGKKVISTYHAALHEDGYPSSTKLATKLTLPLAGCVTFVSRGVEESFYGESAVFREDLMGKKKHFTIYNGIDVEAIDRAVSGADRKEIRRSLSVADDDIFLLNAGRLTEQKGQVYLIEAMKEVVPNHPNAKLLILGEGELKGALEALIAKCGLKGSVRIMPPTRDIFRLMAACDIFVFPSVWESFGLALAEAMAAGKPVVATNVTGVNELIIAGESGILVRPRDAAGFVEAIERIIEEPSFGESIALKAKHRAREYFNVSTMVGLYEKLYGQA